MSTTKEIKADISESKAKAIAVICELTGDNPEMYEQMSTEQLFTMLSFLIKCEKEKIDKLFREHDFDKPLDAYALNQLWKLINKGIVKYKNKEFASLDNSVYEQLKINFALKSREVMTIGTQHFQEDNKANLHAKVSMDKVKTLLGLITQKLDQFRRTGQESGFK